MGNSEAADILLVGARTVRQGTGPFIAQGLASAGARICGVVGTRESTVAEALANLQRDQGISTTGFTDLSTALEQLRPDAVALCSPWRFHLDQLRLIADSDSHCLVEKPLAWPASESQVAELVHEFESRNLLLQLVGQWPTTLKAFEQLHGSAPKDITRFRMRLSPISIGEDMVTDSAPHFISMLQTLAGTGDCLDCRLQQPSSDKLSLYCRYQSASTSLQAELLLQTCEQRPRPAWYEINGLRADRQVSMPEYQQSLVSGDRKALFSDPIHQVAADFLSSLRQGANTEGEKLRCAHHNLQQLAAAWS